MKEIYRHYGSQKFDPKAFIPISNKMFSNKPSGGLWACPTVDVDISWDQWSRDNEFCTDKLKEYFDFKLKRGAKILIIKNIKDLDKLPRVKSSDEHKDIIDWMKRIDSNILGQDDIDFEELAKNYDGIMVWMYRSKDIDTTKRLFDGMYYRMYGWDVDTLLVFNPDIVEVIE